MEAKEVIDKILSEAKNEANDILNKAKQEVADYQKQTASQLADFDKQSEQLAADAADDKKRRILAAARMKSRKDLLFTKQKVLSEVFEAAKQKLISMDTDSYRKLFTELICSAVESGDETVIAGKDETLIDADLIEKINQDDSLKNASNLKFAKEKGEFDRGVILVRGDVRVNISIEVLLQMARESLETAIASELFAQ